jgi:hypothetical protein
MQTFKRNTIAIALLGCAGTAAIAQTTQAPQTTQPGPAPAQTQQQPATSPGATSPGAAPRAATSAPKVMFESMDRDRDGSISRAEAAADQQVGRQFEELDRNRDGKLDAGEFPGSRK